MNNTNNCEHSEQYSRAKRGNTLNQRERIFQRLKLNSQPEEIAQSIISYQFNYVYQPKWFGTLQWIPFIKTFPEAVKEASHFNNKLFTSMFQTKLRRLPAVPERPRIIWFHERTSIIVNPLNESNPKYRQVYHSHFHLGECPDPYNNKSALEALIQLRVAPRFRRLSTNQSRDNKGVVVKPWIRQDHATYNLKDYYSFKHDQDSDLVIDYQNSDLEFPESLNSFRIGTI